MKGKRLINQQHINQQPAHRPVPSKLPAKRKLNDVRSLQPKLKPLNINTANTQPLSKMQQPISSASDYNFLRQQRATVNYISIGESPHQTIQSGQPQFRSQRNSESREYLMQRQNNIVDQQRRQNNFIRQSETHFQQNPAQRIKIFSAEQKDKSWSRSDNNSAKKRSGIQLTKTLLKRISGMYTDKDFPNKVSSIHKSKEETTGIMTMTMSGRGVCDEYQLSDYDFQVNNNHTLNSHHNPLFYNNQTNNPQKAKQFSQVQRINDSSNWHRGNNSGNWQKGNDSANWQKGNDSGNWQKGNDSGNWQNGNESGNWQRCIQSANRQTGNQSGNRRPGSNSGDWVRQQNCQRKININQSLQSYQQILRKSKQEAKGYPKRDLSKVKSYELLNNRPMAESIVVGMEPPALQQMRRGGQIESDCQDGRYLIRSKGKTLDQLSMKQSMVVGFDNYYH